MTSGNPFRKIARAKPVDPYPDVLTEEERAYIAGRIEAGAPTRADLVRKLIRLGDERLDRIQQLESDLSDASADREPRLDGRRCGCATLDDCLRRGC